MTAPPITVVDINGRFLVQPVTGVQRYAIEVVSALDRLLAACDPRVAGVRVAFHVPHSADAGRLPLQAMTVVRHGGFDGHVWEQFVLPGRLSGQVLFCPANTAPIATLLSSRPVVVTVHDLSFRYHPAAYDPRFRAWYRLLTPLIMRRACRVITVSESERRAITSLYTAVAARIAVIQNGAGFRTLPRLEAGDPAEKEPLPERFVLYVGSLSARKNFQGVLAAFLRLAAEDPALSLVVAGGTGAALRDLQVEVPEVHRARILFLGQVDDGARLAALYRRAACFVFPSYYEASPLPPIEAMTFGCPVVASSIPALRERCGDAAEYCDPESVESIAGAMRRILADPLRAEELRRRGGQRAAAFTWEECACRTLEVLRAAAGRAKVR